MSRSGAGFSFPVWCSGIALSQFVWLMPLISWRPNRIASPESYYIYTVHSAAAVTAAVLLLTLTAGIYVLRRPSAGRVASSKDASGSHGFGAGLIALQALTYLQFVVVAALLLVWGAQIDSTGRIMPSFGWWAIAAGWAVQLHSLQLHKRYRYYIALGAAVIFLLIFGKPDMLAVIQEYQSRADRFYQETLTHLQLAFGAVTGACLIGIPLGIAAYRSPKFGRVVFTAVSGIQTVPSLALFGLLIAPLALLSQSLPMLRAMGLQGIGFLPAFIALLLYSLLPIVRNTYTSLSVLPRSVLEAGSGMGMTRRQLFRLVELPLSLPIVLAGVRTAAVQSIGSTTVAALIGAGGLGNFVFQGLGQGADDLIVMGVLPIIILAVVVDRAFSLIVRRLDYRQKGKESSSND
ncbi:MAG: ABC transporter permease [Spirochaeta sp.]